MNRCPSRKGANKTLMYLNIFIVLKNYQLNRAEPGPLNCAKNSTLHHVGNAGYNYNCFLPFFYSNIMDNPGFSLTQTVFAWYVKFFPFLLQVHASQWFNGCFKLFYWAVENSIRYSESKTLKNHKLQETDHVYQSFSISIWQITWGMCPFSPSF